MNKKQSPQKEPGSQFKKTIKNYTISYCPKQFLGRSLYGEVRLGFENNQRRVKAIRINSLPMSEQAKANLSLQKYYCQISNCARQIYDTFETQSNRYTVMEYFPRTFKTELPSFRKLTKNLEPYIEKFLQTYSKLYYYRIYHGNISIDNIGVSFDGKVKLMDFRSLEHLSFQEASMKDYRDFRNVICFIMERDRLFPAKFDVFDDAQGDWEKLFSAWHVVNPYMYIFREKKEPHQNILVLLSKLEATIFADDEPESPTRNPCLISRQHMSSYLRIAFRLLMLSNLHRIGNRTKRTLNQLKQLQRIMSPLQQHDISFYNSVLWSAVQDNSYLQLHQMQRLTLIMCLLPFVNHEYFYIEVLKQFQPNKEDAGKFGIFGNSLLHHYSEVMMDNLIKLGTY